MITPLTQTALTILNNIACELPPTHITEQILPKHVSSEILVKLEAHGLVRLLLGKSPEYVLSYELTRPAREITLLDVLEAIDDHLDCNQELHEDMYLRYGIAARKLGVVNRITRLYLSEIKLTDL